ncbi:MAG: hypothetical protein IJ464_06520 [Alistipes sp.]|nr:hypothetical protein [Alistipes sp.]
MQIYKHLSFYQSAAFCIITIIVENLYSVEDCVEWYCDKLYDAAEDGDKEEFTSLTEDFLSWRALLEKSEKILADETLIEWYDDNSVKAEVIGDFGNELDL